MSDQVAYMYSFGYSQCKNSCQKNLNPRPWRERGSYGACCSSVWLMIGLCSLWSMTGPQRTSPIATTQMWQADHVSRYRPRWEQDRWEASLQSMCHKLEPNRLLKESLQIPIPYHLEGTALFWFIQQVFSIYVLTLVFFTLPCCTAGPQG